MSKMTNVVQRIKDAGVPVWETKNWTTADVQGKTWTPVGVMVHHTAMKVPLSVVGAQVRNRFSAPLCNFIVRRSGQIDLVCDGYAYDSGPGNSQVLREIRNGIFRGGTAKNRGLTEEDVSGNPWFVDIEVDHHPDMPPLPDAAYKSLIILVTAICQEFGWDKWRVLGHKEWTDRKIDPLWGAAKDMPAIRQAVGERLGTTPTNPPPPAPVPTDAVNVLGPPSATVWQLTQYGSRGTRRFKELAVVAWQESVRLGVDPAVTYAVMAHETGFGGFSGVVPASYHNWGGIKTASGGGNHDPSAHARFPDDRTGVRAVVQHLALYAGLYVPQEEVVDPRHAEGVRGRAGVLPGPTWTWASDGPGWSERIAQKVRFIQEIS